LERLARRRRLIALVGALAGCGGPAKPPAEPPRAAAPAPDPCDVYAGQVTPSVTRIDRAAEAFLVRADEATSEAELAAAARDLAATLDAEKPMLAAIDAPDELTSGHAELTTALDGLAGAVRHLASTYAAGADEPGRRSAAGQLSAAATAWENAARRLRTTCPNL
jgi:hypothetical protein